MQVKPGIQVVASLGQPSTAWALAVEPEALDHLSLGMSLFLQIRGPFCGCSYNESLFRSHDFWEFRLNPCSHVMRVRNMFGNSLLNVQ